MTQSFTAFLLAVVVIINAYPREVDAGESATRPALDILDRRVGTVSFVDISIKDAIVKLGGLAEVRIDVDSAAFGRQLLDKHVDLELENATVEQSICGIFTDWPFGMYAPNYDVASLPGQGTFIRLAPYSKLERTTRSYDLGGLLPQQTGGHLRPEDGEDVLETQLRSVLFDATGSRTFLERKGHPSWRLSGDQLEVNETAPCHRRVEQVLAMLRGIKRDGTGPTLDSVGYSFRRQQIASLSRCTIATVIRAYDVHDLASYVVYTPAIFAGRPPAEQRPRVTGMNAFESAILDTVEPETWIRNCRSPGLIRPLGDRLVVRQIEWVHQEVSAMLEDARKRRANHASVEIPAAASAH